MEAPLGSGPDKIDARRDHNFKACSATGSLDPFARTTRLVLAFRPRSRTHTGSSPVRAAAPEALDRATDGRWRSRPLCGSHASAPPKIDLRPAKTTKLGSREAMPIGAPSAGHAPRPYVARSKGDRHAASLYVGAAGRPAPACKRASTYHVGEVCLLSGRGRSAEHRPRNRSPDRYAVFNSAASG